MLFRSEWHSGVKRLAIWNSKKRPPSGDEAVVRKLSRFLFACVAGGLFLSEAACQRRTEYFGNVTPPPGNVFRFNNGPEPEYLDPGLMNDIFGIRIAAQIFEGLTTKDPKTLQPRPGMAEHWEVSPDGYTYTFYLRKDARWSDGRPVTAQDFVYTWVRVLDPRTGARNAFFLYYIVKAEAFNKGELKDPSQLGLRALDDHTLEVRLREPVPFFTELVSLWVTSPVPRWVLEQYRDHWTDPAHIVSNGPYKLVAHRIHDRLELVPNELYWDARQVRVSRIIAYSIDDFHAAVNMYQSGDVDWLPGPFGIPPEFAPFMRGRFRDFTTPPMLGTVYYFFNMKQPALNQALVRRSLSLAVDRRAITDELLREGDVPSARFVPWGMPAYPSPPPPEYNPQEAARLLAQAGYPGGKAFPTFELLVLPNQRRVAEAIQAMWAHNLNIQVSIRSVEMATLIKRDVTHDFDIGGSVWFADYADPSDYIELLESTNPNNYAGWKNAEYDGLLAKARQEMDPQRRTDLLRRAESILLDESPVLPLYSTTSMELMKPYVKGAYPAAWDVPRLNRVWIDYQWREHLDHQGGEQ